MTLTPKAVGGGGDASSAVEKSAGDVPQILVYFSNCFLDTFNNFAYSSIFTIKWPEP